MERKRGFLNVGVAQLNQGSVLAYLRPGVHAWPREEVRKMLKSVQVWLATATAVLALLQGLANLMQMLAHH